MANLSQIRRKKMLEFLETLKEQHTDDASLIAINQIERELTAKNKRNKEKLWVLESIGFEYR